MATTSEPVELNFPELPTRHDQFLQHVAAHPKTSLLELLEPYKRYDAELRKAFAQQPDHPATKQPNVLPVFAGHEKHVTVRARNIEVETEQQRDCYIMPLKDEHRKPDGTPATVQSLRDFQTNFGVFTESSLADLDWSNVIAAGSAVVTSLLAVPEKHSRSKRALRQYYHDQLAPASDVDLFLYGLTEEQAIEKIEQIERNVRDALLVETTVVRTKNAITIASKHPVRHVQIVLRLYKSISEILTGFDVDCSCAAYDGKQVYVSPRALVSFMTQINTIDLTRRSPSYENRLSKYARRGFEVYWPALDRSRIDPTIFERSFGRTEGLARLLILEKLPSSEERESYLAQRRDERGRPSVYRNRYRNLKLFGNIKDEHEDEVADWVDEEVSDYHTVTVPYGPNFHARKIEKLLFTKDMLLNAEWNKPKDREVHLHRHPAFFGSADDIIQDCCGYCPEPSTVEEEEVAEEESKKFIKGALTFMRDDPGRQAIGSFNPIDAEGWTEMAYVGNTASLCQGIIDEDVGYVQSWLAQEANDPNTRDYTGRTPLHLAVTNSSLDIVQALIDGGARMVARLVDGRTALHLAAMRGSVEMVSALLRKSAANEEEEEAKVDARRIARKAARDNTVSRDTPEKAKMPNNVSQEEEDEDEDVDMIEGSDVDTEMNDVTTEGSMVDVRKKSQPSEDALLPGEDEDEPDVYDVNVVAWDTAVSPLHLAIVQGHVDVVKCLVQEFGADVLLPIKLFNDGDKSARAAVLTLVLAMQLGFEKAQEMVKTLISLGASTAQADMDQRTVLQFAVADRPDMLATLNDIDVTGFRRALNHLAAGGYSWRPDISSPLNTAIEAKDALTAVRLLAAGARPEIDFSAYMKAIKTKHKITNTDSTRNKTTFQEDIEQPVIGAIKADLPGVATSMVTDYKIDVNLIANAGWEVIHNDHRRNYMRGQTLLDAVRERVTALREWTFKPSIPKAPSPLKADEEYLSNYTKGTYAHHVAKLQVERARFQYEHDLKRYEEDLEEAKGTKGVDEKQAAIRDLVAEFERLEKLLIDRGAKSFYDLRPEIKEPRPDSPRRNYSYDSPNPEEFAVKLDFQLGDLEDETREEYVRLFQAAWDGDVEAVRDLTTKPWMNANEDDQPPLKIAVQDDEHLSPFAIAVLQDHRQLAETIMEIASEQYVEPADEQKRRYGIEGGGDDDESDDGDDDVKLYSEVEDDEFTKEDVGEVSLEVKSDVSPLQMLRWECSSGSIEPWIRESEPLPEKKPSNGFSYFGPRKPHALTEKRSSRGKTQLASALSFDHYEHKTSRSPENPFQLAMHNDDLSLLNFLLELGHAYQRKLRSTDEQQSPAFFELEEHNYTYALHVGRPRIFAELAKRIGAGLPLNELADTHGIEIKEKPKFYQGLTVRGTKRKDWAARDGEVATTPSKQTPPLLETIDSASLDLVEWWISDAPMRCYKEFADVNQDDKRVQRLVQSQGGFEGAVRKFLSTRSTLTIHCAILAYPSIEAMKVLRYVLEVMPENIEAKNLDGWTPLQVAFATFRKDAAQLLIEAGADQTCRDHAGRNLVHHLLDNVHDGATSIARLRAMLELIDNRLVREMFLQRSATLTPLASWMERAGAEEDDVQLLKTILSYSGGGELAFINGEGETPLHYAVKRDNVALVQAILEHDATLLNRENATGRTPYEMSEDAIIAGMCADPPPMPSDWRFEHKRALRYGLPSHWHDDVLRKSEEDFAADKQEPPRSAELEVWQLLQRVRQRLIAEGKAKRRLVTLHEANEVARRLAGMVLQRSKGRVQCGSDAGSEQRQEAVTDEVQQEIGRARSESWFVGWEKVWET